MKKPTVSIIIPVYNLKKCLKYCVKSVLEQTYDAFEILLIDDGSTDGSSELCDDLSKRDERIKAIHIANSGVSAARNTGIKKATGDFIMFLDGDDIISSNAIEVLINDYYKTRNCVFAGFSYCRINQYDYCFPEAIYDNKIYNHKRILYGLMSHGYENIGAVAKIFPANLVKENRFVEGKGANEDKFFLFQYLIQHPGNVSERDDKLYGYYVRPGSATQSGYSPRLLDMIYFSNQIIKITQKEIPELIEAAKYNDIFTKLSVLRIIVREKMYKKERKTFSKIKESALNSYRYKKKLFSGKYKFEIASLMVSDLAFIITEYMIELLSNLKHFDIGKRFAKYCG